MKRSAIPTGRLASETPELIAARDNLTAAQLEVTRLAAELSIWTSASGEESSAISTIGVRRLRYHREKPGGTRAATAGIGRRN